MFIFLGAAGFLLYFVYDLNSVLWKNRFLHTFFMVGCICIVSATLGTTAEFLGKEGLTAGFRWAFLAAAVFFLVLLVYTLFFALPFDETYRDAESVQKVYDKGMYALCRHPGVLWFFLFYFFLGLAFRPSDMFCQGMFYTFCNVLYIIFQDFWTFPKTFDTYDEYKKTTPFLIPNIRSIKSAYHTRKSACRKRGREL